MRRILIVWLWLVAAVLAPAPLTAPAFAQNEALQFILEQARQRQTRPRAVRSRPAAPRIIEVPRRAVPQAPVVVVRDTPGAVKVEPTIFVVVFGDSMGEFLGGGLEESLADAPDISVTRRTRAESGLVRADFYDWPKSIREFLAGNPKINFAVIQLGVNDRQSIRDEAGQSHEPGSDRWRALYSERVEIVARAFAEKQIPLLWVGLPPMPYANYSATIKDMNELTRAAAGRAGAQFIDVWDSFADGQGRYSTLGPDINGQTTRLRAADGVHFSKTGARKAAHFVEIELKRMIGNRAPTSVIALPADPSAATEKLPIEALPGGVERMIDAMVAGRAEAALQVQVPVKPVAGPILPLTQPVSAKDGVLATRTTATVNGALSEHILDHGRPQLTKPGRADDFQWPPR